MPIASKEIIGIIPKLDSAADLFSWAERLIVWLESLLTIDAIAGTGAATAGAVNSIQVEVDFGATENNIVTTTVAAAWVAAGTELVASVAYEATADHSGDEALVEGVTAVCGNIVAGVGFDLIAFAPNNTWGRYKINVVGV